MDATITLALLTLNKITSENLRYNHFNGRYTRFNVAEVRKVADFLGFDSKGTRAAVLSRIVTGYKAGTIIGDLG